MKFNLKKIISCVLIGMTLSQTPIASAERNVKWIMDSDEDNIFDANIEEYYAKFIDHIVRQDEEIHISDDHDINHRVLDIFQYSDYRTLVLHIFYDKDNKLIKCKYLYDKEDGINNLDYIHSELDKVMSNIYTDDMNDWDKVLATYKYICENFTYYKKYAKKDSKYLVPNPYHPENKNLRLINLYDLFTTKQGVCHTFVYFLNYCLQKQNIDCYAIMDQDKDSMDAHLYSMVVIDGKAYNVDPTFEITDKYKLRYFGETATEKSALLRGSDKSYADVRSINIMVDNKEFQVLRDAKGYEYVGNNNWKIKFSNGVKYFNTNNLTLYDEVKVVSK